MTLDHDPDFTNPNRNGTQHMRFTDQQVEAASLAIGAALANAASFRPCGADARLAARAALEAAHPTINTTEELRGVYAGSILEDAVGNMWGIDGETDRLFFIRDGVDETYNDDAIPLPATVLHSGSAYQ